MKKILLIFVCLFLTVGCSCTNKTAKEAVKDYLNDYKSLNDNVLANIDTLVNQENLEGKDKENYREIIKKQYRDLTFEIENENYNGDTCNVTVGIMVYDLYKVQKKASEYLNSHKDEFLTDGNYDSAKYLSYKLEKMKEFNETINYTIVIKVNKVNGKWVVEQPTDETLEKIHGIYNYDKD